MDQKGYESGSGDEVTSPIKLVAKDDGSGPSNIRCVVCGDPVAGGENELREHMRLHFHGIGIEDEFNWLIQRSLNPTYEDATRRSRRFQDQQLLASRAEEARNMVAAAPRSAAAAAHQEEMDVDVDVNVDVEGEGDHVPDDAQSETD